MDPSQLPKRNIDSLLIGLAFGIIVFTVFNLLLLILPKINCFTKFQAGILGFSGIILSVFTLINFPLAYAYADIKLKQYLPLTEEESKQEEVKRIVKEGAPLNYHLLVFLIAAILFFFGAGLISIVLKIPRC